MKTLFTIIAFSLYVNSIFTQSEMIDINNMNITITPTNLLFFNSDTVYNPYFETIKGSGQSTVFATATWMFGQDATNQLKGSYEKFIDSSNRASSTGPLTCIPGSGTGGLRDFGPATITQSEIAKWNKVFCVNKWEIDLFLRWHKSSNKAIDFPGYTIPTNITDWPAHGDVSLSQDYYLAPFYDSDADGVYNPANGDYPCIKGDKYCWYIINDKGYVHQTEPIGVEMHVEVYAYDRDSLNPLSNAIFIGKDIINRSTQTLFNFRVGQYSDLDIGCSHDDYIGSMPSLNSYYGYNADATDDNCSGGKTPYGSNPPAQGVTFLNKTMDKSMYYNNSAGNQGDPDNPIEAYRYLYGKWKDGTPLNYGGNGFPSSMGGSSTSGIVYDYMFPYITPTGMAPWTEISAWNPAGDRRMLGSVDPITLTPGQVHEVDIAFVFSRSDSGNLKSVDKLYQDIQSVQSFYNDSIPATCQAFVLSIPKENLISAKIYPNPTSNYFIIETNVDILKADITSIDGKLIESEISLEKSSKIDVSNWQKGMYLIRIYNDQGNNKVLRIIKN